MSIKTIGVDELAKLLHRSPETIRSDARRRPNTLPPMLRIPKTRRLLWLEEDVIVWMKAKREAE